MPRPRGSVLKTPATIESDAVEVSIFERHSTARKCFVCKHCKQVFFENDDVVKVFVEHMNTKHARMNWA